MQSSKKKVSVSKNRKKSWRKYCDVSEVEDHLEEKRKEEILGGPVSEKPDEQIFFQDKTEIPKKGLKKKCIINKPLRCFESLENSSKLDPIVKPLKLKTRIAVRKMQRLFAKKYRPKEKNTNANNVRNAKNILRSYNNEMVTGTYNIWDPEDAPFGEKLEAEIEDEQINGYYKEVLKKKSFKVPKVRLPKAVLSSAVDIPHQGASYNPSYEDHQTLLKMAIVEVEKEVKEDAKLQRKAIPSVNAAKLAESYLEEMSQGLIETSASGDESDVDCSAPLSINPPVRAEDRRTKLSRRRASEHKKRISDIRVKKIQAYREREALKIPRLKGEIAAEEARSQARKLKRAQQRATKALQPKRTSRDKYKALNIDVTLSSNLVGSLYRIKTEGNLASDRMKSFERRSIIETRSVGRKLKKLKRKTYIKRSYRDE